MPFKFGFSLGQPDRPKTRPAARAPGFHAVSIRPQRDACEAALAARGNRILAEEVPLLPLKNCDRPEHCACRYQHFDDRRDMPRRQADGAPPSPPAGHEADRRASHGRRAEDRPDFGLGDDTGLGEMLEDAADTYYGYRSKS